MNGNDKLSVWGIDRKLRALDRSSKAVSFLARYAGRTVKLIYVRDGSKSENLAELIWKEPQITMLFLLHIKTKTFFLLMEWLVQATKPYNEIGSQSPQAD